MAQIKGLFNEWFAAETSEKVRHVLRSKKEAGQYISKVPYGYKPNPHDRHPMTGTIRRFGQSAAKKERTRAEKRLAEIPDLITKAFEQNASGKLPDDIYSEMMDGYQQEREELAEKLDSLNAATCRWYWLVTLMKKCTAN